MSVLGKRPRSQSPTTILDLPDDVLKRVLHVLCNNTTFPYTASLYASAPTAPAAQAHPGNPAALPSSAIPHASFPASSESVSERSDVANTTNVVRASTSPGRSKPDRSWPGLFAPGAPPARPVNERILIQAAAASPLASTCTRIRSLWLSSLRDLRLYISSEPSDIRIASIVASLSPSLRSLRLAGCFDYTFSALFRELARCNQLRALTFKCDGSWTLETASLVDFCTARKETLRVLRLRDPRRRHPDGARHAQPGPLGTANARHARQPASIGSIVAKCIADANMSALIELHVPLRFESNVQLYRFWQNLGENIRNLCLDTGNPVESLSYDRVCLEALVKCCPNLQELHLGCDEDIDETSRVWFTRVCHKYRGQLIRLVLRNFEFTDAFASKLYDRKAYPCLTSVALINCKWQTPATVRSILSVIGPLVTKFQDNNARQSGLGPLLKETCPNLQELHIATSVDAAIQGFHLNAFLGPNMRKFSYYGLAPYSRVIQSVDSACRLSSLGLGGLADLPPVAFESLLVTTGNDMRHLDLSELVLPQRQVLDLFDIVRQHCQSLMQYDVPNPHADFTADGDTEIPVDIVRTDLTTGPALALLLKIPTLFLSTHRAELRLDANEMTKWRAYRAAMSMFTTFFGNQGIGPVA